MAPPLATAMQVLGRDLHNAPDDEAYGFVGDALQLLAGALDRAEEAGGFWHETVSHVVQAVTEWEVMQGNRPADLWAASLGQESYKRASTATFF